MDIKNDKYVLVSLVAIIAIVGIVAILLGGNKVFVVFPTEELNYDNIGGQAIETSMIDESNFEESDLTKYLLAEKIVKRVVLNGCDTLEILKHDRLVETEPGIFTTFDSDGEPLRGDYGQGMWNCYCIAASGYNGPAICTETGPQECHIGGTCTQCVGRFIGGGTTKSSLQS